MHAVSLASGVTSGDSQIEIPVSIIFGNPDTSWGVHKLAVGVALVPRPCGIRCSLLRPSSNGRSEFEIDLAVPQRNRGSMRTNGDRWNSLSRNLRARSNGFEDRIDGAVTIYSDAVAPPIEGIFQ